VDNNTTAPACGAATFTVSIFAPNETPAPEPEPTNETVATGADTNGTSDPGEDETLPGPGFAVALAAGLGLLGTARRRRG
jgi:MYXO-CTERM domain-containing protein